MSDSAPAGETVVPVKITQSEEEAPPSLAEPASGPVAEMSGALAQADAPSADADADSKPAERESHYAQVLMQRPYADLCSPDSYKRST
jgi:hypothetical protein